MTIFISINTSYALVSFGFFLYTKLQNCGAILVTILVLSK